MEREVKTIQYIEFIYEGTSRLERVESRDPLLVDNFDNKVGFRYFDTYEVDLDDETLSGALRRNASGMYYFGTRRKNADGKEIIACDCGVEIDQIGKNDVTIEELLKMQRKEKDSQIHIDRKSFFKGVAKVLSIFERQEYKFESHISAKATALNYSHSFTGNSENHYSITLNGTPIIMDSRVGKLMDDKGVIDCSDIDMTIDFATVTGLAEPLYEDYPYLRDLIDKMRIEVLLNGSLNERDILSIARKYALERLDNVQKEEVVKGLLEEEKKISLEQKRPQ